ncbi:YlxQ family RNA-binding protein [Brevibacillus sp. H7]|jgi:ribosomal protein L7Ae-like RNA K-turn-binding protein|uniref:YlxQ family RNA-binding protein n=1 Tax=Brevibacillus sp. H7 TaxID=3349138 RepID=UPI0037FFA639
MIPKVAQMLGLAMRARKVVTGEELVVGAVRSGQAKLVLLAADASANTTKKVTDKCRHYGVPCYAVADRFELGRAIGKDSRVTLAITDSKMAESIQHLLTPIS